MALTANEATLSYTIRRMVDDGIDVTDTGAVIIWMVNNPLPDQATREAVLATKEEEDKQRQIAALKDQLATLEGR